MFVYKVYTVKKRYWETYHNREFLTATNTARDVKMAKMSFLRADVSFSCIMYICAQLMYNNSEKEINKI